MDKKKNLIFKKTILVKSEKEKNLFSSQTLHEMEMASLVGGDEIVPYGGFNALICPEFNACVSFNVVCVNCGCGGGGSQPPRPSPLPGGSPGYYGGNCVCTNTP